MKTFGTVALIFGVMVVVIVLGILVQAGLFYKPAVTEGVTGPYTLVYLEHTGDYAQTGKIQMDIYNSLIAEFGITTTKGFGIYLDDPKTVAKDKLRSEVGCILEGDNIKKAGLVTSKFKVKTLEPKKSLIAEHPFSNPLSIIIGISKVYPLFSKHLGGKPSGYTYSMELYDVPGKKIIYIMR
jgi:hypothetical protein